MDPFLGDEICELVPLRVLKPKMTPARVVAVPLGGSVRSLSDKIMKAIAAFVTKMTFTSQFLA